MTDFAEKLTYFVNSLLNDRVLRVTFVEQFTRCAQECAIFQMQEKARKLYFAKAVRQVFDNGKVLPEGFANLDVLAVWCIPATQGRFRKERKRQE